MESGAPPKRQLAAIMFADVVGFTIIMGKNEQQARYILKRMREALYPTVEKHKGRVLKETGDGSLSTFSSAISAVRCAIELQRAVARTETLKLRISVHVGDVIIEGNDVFGDGVNIAARIEPLALPGGICVSGRVFEDIRNQGLIKAVPLGKKKLKNIENHLSVYALVGEGLEYPKPKQPRLGTGLILRWTVSIIALIALVFVSNLLLKDKAGPVAGAVDEAIVFMIDRGLNPMVWPAIAVSFLLYMMGFQFAGISRSKGFRTFGLIAGLVLSLPGILYVLNIFPLLDRFTWLHYFRSLPWSELAAGGVGFYAGFYTGTVRYEQDPGTALKKIAVLLLAFIIPVAPHLESALYRMDFNNIGNHWDGFVCTQSTNFTSGPCCVATIIRDAGFYASELELAKNTYTSRHGTENCYMARELRKKGFDVSYRYVKQPMTELPIPSIANVKIGDVLGPAHYITVLFNTPSGYIIGDPLDGKLRLSAEQLKDRYYFNGVFIVAELRKNR